MNDFIILCKPVNLPTLDAKKLSIEYVQMSYLIQNLTPQEQTRIKDFEIDKNSIRFEVLEGRLCVICVAFRKPQK